MPQSVKFFSNSTNSIYFLKTYWYPVHVAGGEEVTSDRISLALREKMKGEREEDWL